jgi:hypothetical protein
MKLEIKAKTWQVHKHKEKWKHTSNNQWIKKESQRCSELSNSENTMSQHSQDATKVCWGEICSCNAYSKGKSQSNSWVFILSNYKKKIKSKVSRKSKPQRLEWKPMKQKTEKKEKNQRNHMSILGKDQHSWQILMRLKQITKIRIKRRHQHQSYRS